jgi:V/A-type H+-transporting ATPase subunit C
MMRNDSSKKINGFYDSYIEKIDMYLLKNILIKKLKDKEIKNNVINEANLQKNKNLIQNIIDSEKKKLPEILINNGFEKEVIRILNDEKIDLLKLDNCITKQFINKIKQVKLPYKCENAKQKFVNIYADIVNIKNILRAKQNKYTEESCKQLFIGSGQEIATWKYNEIAELESIPQIIKSLEGTSYYNSLRENIENYNLSGSIQVFENAIDTFFLKLVKDISLQNYATIGPTIRFVVSKEYEIKNLKIIAKGIGEGLSLDSIKNFLIMESST